MPQYFEANFSKFFGKISFILRLTVADFPNFLTYCLFSKLRLSGEVVGQFKVIDIFVR